MHGQRIVLGAHSLQHGFGLPDRFAEAFERFLKYLARVIDAPGRETDFVPISGDLGHGGDKLGHFSDSCCRVQPKADRHDSDSHVKRYVPG